MRLIVVFLFVLCGVVHLKVLKMTCKRIRAFVNGHNIRRLELARGEVPGQPAASEMYLMVWDSELAAKAAVWASKNDFNHNPDKTIGSGRFRTGENLYLYATTDLKHKLNIDNAIEYWFDEYKDFDFGPLTRNQFDESSKIQIGHYTQMVWADSVYIGCAISKFRKKNMKHFIIVCNYGPSGNYLNLTPYKTDLGPSYSLVCHLLEDQCFRPYGREC